MTTKSEWIEYFELMNNRKPTAEEILQALDDGDFNVNTPSKDAVDNTNQQVANGFESAKAKTGNYFKWLKGALAHPVQAKTDENNHFGLITLLLSVLAMSLNIWVIVSKSLAGVFDFAQAFISSTSYGSESTMSWLQWSLLIPTLVLIALVYFAIVLAGFLTRRIVFQQENFSFKQSVEYYGRILSVVLILNVIALFCSVVISKESLNSILLYVIVIMIIFISSYSIISADSGSRLDSFYAALIGNAVFAVIFGLVTLIGVVTIGSTIVSSLFQ